MSLALGRDLSDQNIARFNFGTDINNTGLIQFRQGALTHVGYVTRNLFGPQLGITSYAGEFLYMNGGKAIFFYHSLTDQYRVFKVVAIPGHKCDSHILSQRKLTQIYGGTIGENVATLDRITLFYDRALVNAGVLIRSRVLSQVIDINRRLINTNVLLINTNHNTASIRGVDDSRPLCDHANTGVRRYIALHPCSDKRLVSHKRRHSLALHVRPHKGTVSIVVLQKRNQSGCHRNDLLRGYIHIAHTLWRHYSELAHVANRNQLVHKLHILVQRRRSLCNNMLSLINSGQKLDIVSNLTLNYLTIGRFKKPIIVGTRIGRQRIDKTDVRAFRCFNRAHTTIVGRMHITHFESGTLARQTTWPKCRYTPFVCHL